MFCKYRDALGVPEKGFHESRLFGLAANDLIGTLIFITGFSYISGYSLMSVFIIVLILTVLVHRIFCVNTALNKKIFGSI